MSPYLIIFLCLHVFLLGVLFMNVLYQLAKQRSLFHNAVMRDKNWMVSVSRCRVFVVRSVINFIAASIGELGSLWLLWMAGVFD